MSVILIKRKILDGKITNNCPILIRGSLKEGECHTDLLVANATNGKRK